jgi:putative DNA primase/helicase
MAAKKTTTNGNGKTPKNKANRHKTRGPGPTIMRSDDPAVPPQILYTEEAGGSKDGDGHDGFSQQDFDLVIQDLARQSLPRYALLRRAQAKFFEVPAWLLDRLVQQARRDHGASDEPGLGRPIEFVDPEPWPEEVDGDSVVTELAATIRAHVVLDDDARDTTALWIIASYCYDYWDIFPRLGIDSAEADCGKSTLLDMVGETVPRPLATVDGSAAVIYRVVEQARPTLLLDEADQLLNKDRRNPELVSALDAGHKRNGQALRCVEMIKGRLEVRQFACFTPAALAGIALFEELPRQLATRTLKVHLDRRRKDEPIEEFSLAPPDPKFERLRRQLVRWINDNRGRLQRPMMPEGVINRDADNWRPLVAIADLVSPSWGERARELVRHAVGGRRDDGSTRIMLLTDVRAAFGEIENGGSDEVVDREGERARITSEALCAYLHQLADRPWPEYGRARKPLNERQLANLLRPLRIYPGTIRFGPNNKETAKGYCRSAFDDAFTRYLPDFAVTPTHD